jgi:NAD(P)-dependent dehydrogenase (short-subunit alcohol dehydrogenase family)
MRFKDKVCIVTGAASGIGKATAMAFAAEGGKVVVADINEAIHETVAHITSQGGSGIAQNCDISNWQSVQELIHKAVETYGRLDCAVNSAGIAGKLSLPTHAYPEDDWHQQMAINLTGAWYFTKACIEQMLKSTGGSIVLVASAAGLRGQPENSPYAASKHGVVGLTKTAAIEYADKGIRINCICPTAIETPMIMQGRRKLAENPEALQAAINLQAMKRMGRPEEIAQVNLWLCSEQASFITGLAMPTDGGALAK